MQQATKIGPACAQFMERRLAERYGSTRLEAACVRALAHDGVFYRTVKTILGGGFDQQPLVAVDSPAPYTRGARFVRDAEDLFGVVSSSAIH